jgi:hypothetical protein
MLFFFVLVFYKALFFPYPFIRTNPIKPMEIDKGQQTLVFDIFPNEIKEEIFRLFYVVTRNHILLAEKKIGFIDEQTEKSLKTSEVSYKYAAYLFDSEKTAADIPNIMFRKAFESFCLSISILSSVCKSFYWTYRSLRVPQLIIFPPYMNKGPTKQNKIALEKLNGRVTLASANPYSYSVPIDGLFISKYMSHMIKYIHENKPLNVST